ncbi:MAG TPA: NADH-quinone oxidoreductase subunit NuoF [Phototrophicaceae bacterium]|nr:NADH-quinone oxidoreductase subunit NuoF [Phototrophicaceae bacterium]
MINEELNRIAEHEHEEDQKYEHHICVCMETACIASRSDQVKDALTQAVAESGSRCKVKGVGCMGLCSAGPLVKLEPEGVMYQNVTPEDATEIVQKLGDSPVSRLECNTNTPFFKRQTKIVLENSGNLDPERIEDYIAADGYLALNNVLTTMSSSETIAQISKSGLRGRGGAGFPVGLKWSTVAKSSGNRKFVICNADEGDPGAFMDRSVLEGDPHAVLEGMTIAAYAVGANQGYIYVRAEYPLAVERVKTAIRQSKKLGLLGENICGTTFSFNIDIRLGAGAFVCGEETALIASIEGRAGQPRPRPPYPAEYGLWGCPTLINNVESYANIAPILRKGADWFASIGTEKSKGTKVFALTGQIVNTGLIEVPMGITLREIIFDIGGGIPDGKKFKAVQTGGPGGGCIPEEYLDVAVEYESLVKLGSFMGSGGMIVMDETSDMVEIAKYFMEFCMTESCGKCVPCRVGTAQIHNLLDKVTKREATVDDLVMLERLCDTLRNTSLCGLGQGAPNPVVSTMRYFRHEYEARLQEAHDETAFLSH